MVRTAMTARRTGGVRVTPWTRSRAGAQVLRCLVLLEVAAALILVGLAAGRATLVPLGVAAAILAVAAVVRHRGRAVPEWAAAALAIRRRRRGSRSAPPGLLDPVLAPLGECDPALRTYSYAGRGARSAGMVGDGTFLTAVLVVRAAAEPLRSSRPLPLGPLLDALEVEDVGLASVQVVQHVRPASVARLPSGSGPMDGPEPRYGMPGARLTWVALRLDPELCPGAVLARGGGLGGAQRAVLRAAEHLAGRLTGAGFDAAVLDEEQLIAALATSACTGTAGPEPPGTVRRRTVERRDAWHCDGLRHTTFALDDVAAAARAVAGLTPVPAAWSFGLTLARGSGGTPLVGGYVRVTAGDDRDLAAACGALQATVRRQGVVPARLDHEQVPGVLATVPLGGTR